MTKSTLTILVSLLFSTQILAETCLERLHNPNWPGDQQEKVLSCKLKEITMGTARMHYGDSICFGIKKTQSSDYENTFYTVQRYNEGEPGALNDIVVVRPNGDVPEKDSSIEFEGNKITMANKHFSFSHNQNWKTESIIDLDKMTVVFNSYDQKFIWWYEQKLSVSFTCETVL
jgi:hypothetical protein